MFDHLQIIGTPFYYCYRLHRLRTVLKTVCEAGDEMYIQKNFPDNPVLTYVFNKCVGLFNAAHL